MLLKIETPFPLNNINLLWLIDTKLAIWVAYIKTQLMASFVLHCHLSFLIPDTSILGWIVENLVIIALRRFLLYLVGFIYFIAYCDVRGQYFLLCNGNVTLTCAVSPFDPICVRLKALSVIRLKLIFFRRKYERIIFFKTVCLFVWYNKTNNDFTEGDSAFCQPEETMLTKALGQYLFIIIPLQAGDCTLREAVIISSMPRR